MPRPAKEYLLDKFSNNPMLVYYVSNRMRDEVGMEEAARILSDALQREHPEFMLEEYPNLPSRDECAQQLRAAVAEYDEGHHPAHEPLPGGVVEQRIREWVEMEAVEGAAPPPAPEPPRDTWAEMSAAVGDWLERNANVESEPEEDEPMPLSPQEEAARAEIRAELHECMRDLGIDPDADDMLS